MDSESDTVSLPPFPVTANGLSQPSGHSSGRSPSRSPTKSPVPRRPYLSVDDIKEEGAGTAIHHDSVVRSSRKLIAPDASPFASAALVYASPSASDGIEVQELDSPARVQEHLSENQKRKALLEKTFNATAESNEGDSEDGSEVESDPDPEDFSSDDKRRSTAGSIYSGVRSAGSWFYRFLGSERGSQTNLQLPTNSIRSNRSSTLRSRRSGTMTTTAATVVTRTTSGGPAPAEPRDPVFNQSFQTKVQNREKSKKAQTLWAKATWYAMQEVNAKRERRNREENHRSIAGQYTAKQKSKKKGQNGNARGSLISQRRNSSAGVGFEQIVLEAMRKDYEQKEKAQRNSVLGIVQRILDSSWFHGAMFLATAYSLYGLDMYILLAPNASRDRDMYITSVTCFAIFALEWVVRTAISERFLWSFFWWLDLIATASFIPDVVWVAKEEDVFASAVGVLVLARAGRVGARMSRIVRVVALFSRTRFRHAKGPTAAQADPTSPEYDPSGSTTRRESHLGRKLDQKVSLHTMMVVGLMLVLIILNGVFSLSNTYHTGARSLALVYDMLGGTADFDPFLRSYLTDMDDQGHEVYYIQMLGEVLHGDPATISSIREYPPEFEIYTFSYATESGDPVKGEIHFSIRDETRREVLLSVINVIVLLVVSTTNISKVIREEVVNPIMSLLDTIEAFATNPLKPLKEIVDQKFKETIVVQNSVVRIGSLLRLSLGEAGSRIMSRNLRSGQMRLDRPGDFVHAFFGFCDIRNFTDLTEVLRPEVVQVVNTFASYVHKAVSQNYGAPNKNIGDAFLLVWKPKAGVSASQMADSALRSYVRIIMEIQTSKELEVWARRDDVQNRIPGYKMAMGFGIHYGWAIECAVGSPDKIDCTYLSPHVNMASRLEAATKQYGVQILISGDTYALFSQEIQMLCRLVDRVTVKGSAVPVDLYTYDVPSPSSLAGRPASAHNLNGDSHTFSPTPSSGIMPAAPSSGITPAAPSSGTNFSASGTEWASDISPIDFLSHFARPAISEDFRAAHYLAMQNYLGGPGGAFANWKAAVDHFVQCLSIHDDGPCRAIMTYIADNSDEGSAPRTWRGFRSLDSK